MTHLRAYVPIIYVHVKVSRFWGVSKQNEDLDKFQAPVFRNG